MLNSHAWSIVASTPTTNTVPKTTIGRHFHHRHISRFRFSGSGSLPVMENRIASLVSFTASFPPLYLNHLAHISMHYRPATLEDQPDVVGVRSVQYLDNLFAVDAVAFLDVLDWDGLFHGVTSLPCNLKRAHFGN